MILLLKFATYNKQMNICAQQQTSSFLQSCIEVSCPGWLFCLFIYTVFKTQRICGTANTINNHNLISYLSRRIKKKENKLKYKQRTFKLDWILYTSFIGGIFLWRIVFVVGCYLNIFISSLNLRFCFLLHFS